MTTEPFAVKWHDHYEPRNCPIHVRNELDMAAPPERVWAWLIRTPLWPAWYFNSSNVKIISGIDQDLREGSRFHWKTFGVSLVSTVREYVPNERIAWDARAFGVDAYHAWVLRPSARGCHVLTEETQHGLIARLGKLFMPNRMYKYHQLWLEALAGKAGAGLPPTG